MASSPASRRRSRPAPARRWRKAAGPARLAFATRGREHGGRPHRDSGRGRASRRPAAQPRACRPRRVVFRAKSKRARLPPVRAAWLRSGQTGAAAGRQRRRDSAIKAEVWTLDRAGFGAFVARIPAPLGVGTIRLSDGRAVQGFPGRSRRRSRRPRIFRASAAGAPIWRPPERAWAVALTIDRIDRSMIAAAHAVSCSLYPLRRARSRPALPCPRPRNRAPRRIDRWLPCRLLDARDNGRLPCRG